MLIIPTASSDTRAYDRIVKRVFCDRLGCRLDYLYLVERKPSRQEIARKIREAEVVYVPGGNTLKMMRLWRLHGVDKLLIQAWRRGTVLSGVSAGAICWFDAGHSDSLSFYNEAKWKYIRVTGMGLVKGVFCPHYGGETCGRKRKAAFARMMQGLNEWGIALDDNCGIEIVDSTFRIISAQKGAGAYRVRRTGTAVVSSIISVSRRRQDIKRLYR